MLLDLLDFLDGKTPATSKNRSLGRFRRMIWRISGGIFPFENRGLASRVLELGSDEHPGPLPFLGTYRECVEKTG